MNKPTRTTFTKEFKENAVRLLVDGNERISALSKRLGVSESVLERWKREATKAGPDAFPGKGHQTGLEEENRRLRKENAKLKEERAILKEAAVFLLEKRSEIRFHQAAS